MFSQKFRELLESRGLTRSEYAEKANTSIGHVSHLATGRRKPSYEEIMKIATFFPDVDLNELLKMDETLSKHDQVNESASEYDASTKHLRMLEYHSKEIQRLVKKLQKATK